MQPSLEDVKEDGYFNVFEDTSRLGTINEAAEENISDDSCSDEEIAKTYITPSFDIRKLLTEKETLSARNREIESECSTFTEMPPVGYDVGVLSERNTAKRFTIETDGKSGFSSRWKPCFSPQAADLRDKEGDDGVRDSVVKINKIVHNGIKSHINPNIFINKNKKLADLNERVNLYSKLEGFKAGYLEQQTGTAITSYERRYCKLECPEFKFFQDTKTRMLAGIVNFERVPAKVTHNSLTFTVLFNVSPNESKQFTFRTKNKEEKEEWVRGIEYCIRLYKDVKKSIPRVNYFWEVMQEMKIVSSDIGGGVWEESEDGRFAAVLGEEGCVQTAAASHRQQIR
eukprot:TRINITY_DN9890_c0_g1_i6.p1 TRINITY_DN9890_c0_g1~~TRINITY_DN9890_c0_g1_i6.p1  ORF type:complete len:342 (+),score=76.08 TRINITY_DN9890_c0_g1_i6:68-1093(+)